MREQLDWLARNVHEWPVGDYQNWCYVGHGYRDLVFVARADSVGLASTDRERVTRQQWLDRRAELQNKPSWMELPTEARYLCQERNGEWGAWVDKPTHDGGLWSADEPLSGFNITNASKYRGEVLGDWRNTLERRPVEAFHEGGYVPEYPTELATCAVIGEHPLSRADALRWTVENVETWHKAPLGNWPAPLGWSWEQAARAKRRAHLIEEIIIHNPCVSDEECLAAVDQIMRLQDAETH
jgi:hypothetical protein